MENAVSCGRRFSEVSLTVTDTNSNSLDSSHVVCATTHVGTVNLKGPFLNNYSVVFVAGVKGSYSWSQWLRLLASCHTDSQQVSHCGNGFCLLSLFFFNVRNSGSVYVDV